MSVGSRRTVQLRSPKTSDSAGSGFADVVSTRSFLERRFGGSWTRTRTNTSPETERGPLGLNLLHLAAEPLIDIIFVHGLRGGSIKTFRKDEDSRLFWPQYWLPADSDFASASIHSFGYNSDWSDKKDSILNVHDFGRALLEEMRNSPHLRRHPTNPIIMVGHSMGGLVIKKAYLLSRQDKSRPEFGSRMRCIFFLATPHRGSDSAQLLNNMLKVSGVMSSREYVTDLEKSSLSTQSINDEFRMFEDDLLLWSFYETLKTSLGMSSAMIVERDSAVLGYKNERTQYINANHREICKFDHPLDPNYLAIKNALASAVDEILQADIGSRIERRRKEMKILREFIGILDTPENECAAREESKIYGSCAWLEDRENFKDWRNTLDVTRVERSVHKPLCYWLSAKPGSGKSVLVSHVVSHLQEFNLDCSYYFFHHGNKSKQTLSGLLRSLAYQMALSNAVIREKLLKLEEDGVMFDKDDERAIWRKIFVATIFHKTPLYRPQYWVIDALDECVRYPEFFTMLSKIEAAFPLRIFVTSRLLHDIQSNFVRLGDRVISSEMRLEDTMKDITRYIQSRVQRLPLEREEDKQVLARKLEAKSGACFLWVKLVLDELEMVYSDANIITVLDEIPEGMVPFYKRTIDTMHKNLREKQVTKAILQWTVSATRPLLLSELQTALNLDLGINVFSIRRSVEDLCGQLVYVDHTDTVRFVHATAREFLLSEDALDFRINKHEAHERLALSCLKYLSGDDMKPPRSKRFIDTARQTPVSPFRGYACNSFSEHVVAVNTEVDSILVALDHFLKKNVLSWIEYTARQGSLYFLSRTARNLRGYLDRRAKYRSPLGIQVETVNAWATDLNRIVSKFGAPLLSYPSSTYFLLPPLCPTNSAIFQQFAKSPGGLVLTGASTSDWQDCITILDFKEGEPTSVTCGERFFAIGFEEGDIKLYNKISCQLEKSAWHHEPVDLLQFDTSGKVLASAGSRSVKLWNSDGIELWTQKTHSRCIGFSFEATTLMGACMNGHVVTWDLATGIPVAEHVHEYQQVSNDSSHANQAKAPYVASFSPDMEIVAIGYRSPHVCLFSLQDHEFLGCVTHEATKPTIYTLLFNPNPNICLLAVAYGDGTLSVFEPWSCEEIVSVEAGESYQGLKSLASSPDGRTLASTDSIGYLKIWDFETLTLLYRVTSSDFGFRMIAFSTYGDRIVDITESRLKVWEPSILIRKSIEDDVSVSDAATLLAIENEDTSSATAATKITVMACHPVLPLVFVGKYNGIVAMKNIATNNAQEILYTHELNAFLTAVCVSSHHIIASGDVNGRVKAWKMEKLSTGDLRLKTLQLERHYRRPIKQILISPDSTRILVSTATTDTVISLGPNEQLGVTLSTEFERKLWMCQTSSSIPSELSLIVDGKIRYFEWRNYPETQPAKTKTLSEPEEDVNYSAIKSIAWTGDTKFMIIDYFQADLSKSTLAIYSHASLAPSDTTAGSEAISLPLTLQDSIHYFVGTSGNRIVFLDADSWLSSFEVDLPEYTSYTRHFFMPNEFVDRETGVLPSIAKDNAIIAAYGGEVVIIKNGL
ncbi:NACHT and WD domain protein, partial [Amylocarpus encephaloides]